MSFGDKARMFLVESVQRLQHDISTRVPVGLLEYTLQKTEGGAIQGLLDDE